MTEKEKFSRQSFRALRVSCLTAALSSREGLKFPEMPCEEFAVFFPLLRLSAAFTQAALKAHLAPWLVWLSWLLSVLCAKGSLLRLPVRARAQVVSLIPGWGAYERQPVDVSLSPSLRLPSSLLKNQ